MNSLFLKVLIPAFFLIFNINTSAQSGVYIYGMGSANYIPKKNFAHSLNASISKDINELGLNGSAGISFAESENNIFLLRVEYIRSEASFS